jgi:hypothetical protein
VPNNLENASKLYSFLQTKLNDRERGIAQEVTIDGFSLYEVDEAFYGHEVYQERTIVIRIHFKREASEDNESLAHRIQVLGHEVAASMAMNEEEL